MAITILFYKNAIAPAMHSLHIFSYKKPPFISYFTKCIIFPDLRQY